MSSTDVYQYFYQGGACANCTAKRIKQITVFRTISHPTPKYVNTSLRKLNYIFSKRLLQVSVGQRAAKFWSVKL